MRCLLLAALFAPTLFGAEISIPLEGGTIEIKDARFIGMLAGRYVPEFSFTMENRTSSDWKVLTLQFEIDGVCGKEARHWSPYVRTKLGWEKDRAYSTRYEDSDMSLAGRLDGCRTESVEADIVLADNGNIWLNRSTGERVDLAVEEARREAEAAERAKLEVAEAIKRKGEQAAQAARLKRLAAKQKRKEAEADAYYARVKAAEAAKAAEEKRRIRVACTAIYQNTADKKMGDLTVKEDQQVKACQALGLYPPR